MEASQEQKKEYNLETNWDNPEEAKSTLIGLLKKCESGVTINIRGITQKDQLRNFVGMVNKEILLPSRFYKQIIDDRRLTYSIITKTS